MTNGQAPRRGVASRLLAAFEIPVYRWLWTSTLLNSASSWVVRVAVRMNTLFQLLTSDEVRGRVLGLYSLTFSMNSLGGMLAGGLAAALGAPMAVAAGGGLLLAYMLGAFKSIRRVQPAELEPAPA